jgi:hypothetical protein
MGACYCVSNAVFFMPGRCAAGMCCRAAAARLPSRLRCRRTIGLHRRSGFPMCRSPEALALGPAVMPCRRRYHCPSFGCLLNRSRDCTRSRVPPLRVGAMLTLLRVPFSLAGASLRRFSLPLCEAAFHRKSGGRRCARTSIVLGKREHDMRKFHSIAALCGDGLRPELRELFDRLAVDPNSELFVRHDGMLQSGPDPKSIEASPVERAVTKRVA